MDWGLNLYRRATALGNVNPEPPATGFGSLRAGVVDADVAFELGHLPWTPDDKNVWGFQFLTQMIGQVRFAADY